MAAPKALKWVVTANLTGDSSVVYMRADQSFSHRVQDATRFDSKDEAEQLRKAALENEHDLTDPYLMEVVETPLGLDLLSARERIRAQGPTVRVRRPDPVTH